MDTVRSTEFDIDRVAPQVDLVQFSNVISCYPSSRDITATYTLGSDIIPSTWDWVGIFRRNWRFTEEYIVYRWAQTSQSNCTAPQRRAVVFPTELHKIPPSAREQYQFLYVSRGNHVIGVSDAFRVDTEDEIDDMDLSILFSEELSPTTVGIREHSKSEKSKLPMPDACGLENKLCLVPMKRLKMKEKMTIVYRNPDILFNLPGHMDWMERLKLTHGYPVVREYDQLDTHVPDQTIQRIKIYANTSSYPNRKVARTLRSPLSIEYPSLQSIKPGPQAFLMSHRESLRPCSSCLVAKTIVEDFLGNVTQQNEKISAYKHSESHNNRANILEFTVTRVQNDNNKLQSQIENLQNELQEKCLEHKEQKTHIRDDPFQDASDENDQPWIVKYPRRFVLLKKVVGKQSHMVQLLRLQCEAKQKQVEKLTLENIRLTKLVNSAVKSSDKYSQIAEEMNCHLKDVLAERSRATQNKWGHFVRCSCQETTTQNADENSDILSSKLPVQVADASIFGEQVQSSKPSTSRRKTKAKGVHKKVCFVPPGKGASTPTSSKQIAQSQNKHSAKCQNSKL